MIPLTPSHCQDRDWKKALAEAIRCPRELLDAVGLRPEQVPGLVDEAPGFPLRVPRGYVSRMRYGDPADPLLRQVLTLRQEHDAPPGFVLDPVGDGPATTHPGLLQKYHGRALIVTTGACPIHCRYCFRRHFPYAEARAGEEGWGGALARIAVDPSLTEVILSGGDPLSLGNERLRRLSEGLRDIPHVKRLRIHTRMPIVLPERVDSGLLAWLETLPWRKVMVVHSNHANEVDAGVGRALRAIQSCGVTVLNQSVLLRQVNDDVAVLAELSETLFEAGVLPYYLHLLDRVQGAAHFEVDEHRARKLLEHLRRRLPGYLVPRLVREVEGAPYKRLVEAVPAENH